jgi:hypothetical protein
MQLRPKHSGSSGHTAAVCRNVCKLLIPDFSWPWCFAGGTLIEAIANSGGKLPERQVAMKVALPMLNALKHLHTTGIVHRCAQDPTTGHNCQQQASLPGRVVQFACA